MNLFRYGMVAVVGLFFLTSVALQADEPVPDRPDLRFAQVEKLKSIVVSVDFKDAKIGNVMTALTILSKQADPDHKGVQFMISTAAVELAKPITLKLDNVPLAAILRYVCELSRVRYNIGDYAVNILPKGIGEEGYVSRTFHVDPDFVQTASRTSVVPSTSTP